MLLVNFARLSLEDDEEEEEEEEESVDDVAGVFVVKGQTKPGKQAREAWSSVMIIRTVGSWAGLDISAVTLSHTESQHSSPHLSSLVLLYVNAWG